MTGRIVFEKLLESVKNQSYFERLQTRLAYLELVDICRKEDPQRLKEAYEEAKRYFA